MPYDDYDIEEAVEDNNETIISIEDPISTTTVISEEINDEQPEPTLLVGKLVFENENFVESPLSLPYQIETVEYLIGITQNEDSIDITSTAVLDSTKQEVSFEGQYPKIIISFSYYFVEEEETEEDTEESQIKNEIEFDEEASEKLEHLYRLFSGFSDTQIQALASNIETATIGASKLSFQTQEQIDEFLECIDDLVYDVDEESAELESIKQTLQQSFSKDVSDYTYNLPIGLESIRQDLSAFFVVGPDEGTVPSETPEEDVIQAFNDAVESVGGVLTEDTIYSAIEEYKTGVEGILTEEEIETTSEIILNHRYEVPTEAEVLASIVRTDLMTLLNDENKVKAAENAIESAVNNIYNNRSGSTIRENLYEMMTSVDESYVVTYLLPESDVNQILAAFDTNIGSTITEDDAETKIGAFISAIENIPSVSGLRESFSQIDQGGDTTFESPLKLREPASEIISVSAITNDEETVDITADVSIDANGYLVIPNIDLYLVISAEYRTTWLEAIRTLLSDQSMYDDEAVYIEYEINSIAESISSYNSSRKIDQETVDILKQAFAKAFGEELDLNTLNAKLGNFEEIVAKIITTEQLNATKANIREATIDTLYVNTLNAKLAIIEQAIIDTLDAKIANIDIANINFANITLAQVEKIFAESGTIKNISIETGTITGELVGVTIRGDLIQGNTLVADKLVIKGEDGLFYKLNMEGGTLTPEQLTDEKYKRQLDGSTLVAKSVTAEKITVDDLVAFNATIGGFVINESAIRSSGKTSYDDNNVGLYQGFSDSKITQTINYDFTSSQISQDGTIASYIFTPTPPEGYKYDSIFKVGQTIVADMDVDTTFRNYFSEAKTVTTAFYGTLLNDTTIYSISTRSYTGTDDERRKEVTVIFADPSFTSNKKDAIEHICNRFMFLNTITISSIVNNRVTIVGDVLADMSPYLTFERADVLAPNKWVDSITQSGEITVRTQVASSFTTQEYSPIFNPHNPRDGVDCWYDGIYTFDDGIIESGYIEITWKKDEKMVVFALGRSNGEHLIYDENGLDLQTAWLQFDSINKVINIGKEGESATIRLSNDGMTLTDSFGTSDLSSSGLGIYDSDGSGGSIEATGQHTIQIISDGAEWIDGEEAEPVNKSAISFHTSRTKHKRDGMGDFNDTSNVADLTFSPDGLKFEYYNETNEDEGIKSGSWTLPPSGSSFISLNLGATQNLTTSFSTLPYTTVISQKGDDLSASGGYVTCNRDGYVEISGGYYGSVSASNTLCYWILFINGSQSAYGKAQRFAGVSGSLTDSISVDSFIIPVNAGDRLSVGARTLSGTAVAGYGGITASYFTVKYVEEVAVVYKEKEVERIPDSGDWISICSGGYYTPTTAGTNINIPFTQLIDSSGEGLELSGGGVLCKYDGYIEINASIQVDSLTDNDNVYGYLLIDGVTRFSRRVPMPNTAGVISFTSIIVPVTQGQRITVQGRNATGARGRFGCEQWSTLTVKYVQQYKIVRQQNITFDLDTVYPVGSIYLSVNNTNPEEFMGGMWQLITDRFLVGAGGTYAGGATGGANTVTLNTDQIPSHRHQYLRTMIMGSESNTPDTGSTYSVTTTTGSRKTEPYTYNTGGGQAHENRPPYLAVYMWQRLA